MSAVHALHPGKGTASVIVPEEAVCKVIFFSQPGFRQNPGPFTLLDMLQKQP